jgi:UDP-glucose 4-epimerase
LVYDKVLVTGGAGFIGSHTVDALLTDGVEVWVLDNISNWSMHNLRKWKGHRKLHFRKNSITRRSVVEALTKRVEAVVHLAAAASPYLSVKKPEVVNEVNVSGTLNVLRAAQIGFDGCEWRSVPHISLEQTSIAVFKEDIENGS